MGGERIPEGIKIKAVNDYLRHGDIDKTCEKYGISVSALNRHRREMGKPSYAEIQDQRRWETLTQAMERYTNGERPQVICEDLGITYNQFKAHRKKVGIPSLFGLNADQNRKELEERSRRHRAQVVAQLKYDVEEMIPYLFPEVNPDALDLARRRDDDWWYERRDFSCEEWRDVLENL